MNKIYKYLRVRLLFVVMLAAIIALTVSQVYVINKMKYEPNRVLSFEEGSADNSVDAENYLNPENIDSSDIPHANCWLRLTNLTPRSNTYNPAGEYINNFVPTFGDGRNASSSYIDINGDNLLDYVFSYNRDASQNGEISASNVNCVYLNNGSGWIKKYECYASTRVDANTGELILGEYAGDCAGESSSAKQEN